MRTSIPDPIEPPAESWARTVHAVNADAAGEGSALQGDWLDRGALYDLATGALVVMFDRAPGGAAIVALHQVAKPTCANEWHYVVSCTKVLLSPRGPRAKRIH